MSSADRVEALKKLSDEIEASRRRLTLITTVTAQHLARVLGRLHRRLARPPRIVLLGEFNSGKTTLANALIGADVLPTSIHANTRLPLHAYYSEQPEIVLELEGGIRRTLETGAVHLLRDGRTRVLHVGLPVERLRMFELIDTPGLASGMSRLEGGNLEACAQAHVALWCTTSTQAWKATEQAAWAALPMRVRRLSALVVTLADMINSERDRSRIVARLKGEAAPGFDGLVMVSAAEIDELRRDPNLPDHATRWTVSGGEALDLVVERLLEKSLAEREAGVHRILARIADRLSRSAPPPGRAAPSSQPPLDGAVNEARRERLSEG